MTTNNQHKRFFLSNLTKEVKVNQLHASLPLPNPRKGWLNLCFDLPNLLDENFKGSCFSYLTSMSIHGSFKLRKIITLKTRPATLGDAPQSVKSYVPMPKSLELPSHIIQQTIVVGMTIIENLKVLAKPIAPQKKSTPPLAFGKCIPKGLSAASSPAPSEKREKVLHSPFVANPDSSFVPPVLKRQDAVLNLDTESERDLNEELDILDTEEVSTPSPIQEDIQDLQANQSLNPSPLPVIESKEDKETKLMLKKNSQHTLIDMEMDDIPEAVLQRLQLDENALANKGNIESVVYERQDTLIRVLSPENENCGSVTEQEIEEDILSNVSDTQLVKEAPMQSFLSKMTKSSTRNDKHVVEKSQPMDVFEGIAGWNQKKRSMTLVPYLSKQDQSDSDADDQSESESARY